MRELADRLRELIQRSDTFLALLVAARSAGLSEWCIGAGAIRSLVWDHMHGLLWQIPADIDVCYFDADHLDDLSEQRVLHHLTQCAPEVPWEVVNQANVHLWMSSADIVRAPYHSLADAIASWPEYATCVGVSLGQNDAIHIIAPHGLDDLFSLVIRRNPQRISVDEYKARLAQKRYHERWPLVRIFA